MTAGAQLDTELDAIRARLDALEAGSPPPDPPPPLPPEPGDVEGFESVLEFPPIFPHSAWDPQHSAHMVGRSDPSGWVAENGLIRAWINRKNLNDKERRAYPFSVPFQLPSPILTVIDIGIVSVDLQGREWGSIHTTFHEPAPNYPNLSVTLIPAPSGSGAELHMSGGISNLQEFSSPLLEEGKVYELAVWADLEKGEYRTFIDRRLVFVAPKDHRGSRSLYNAHWGAYATGTLEVTNGPARMYTKPNAAARALWGGSQALRGVNGKPSRAFPY